MQPRKKDSRIPDSSQASVVKASKPQSALSRHGRAGGAGSADSRGDGGGGGSQGSSLQSGREKSGRTGVSFRSAFSVVLVFVTALSVAVFAGRRIASRHEARIRKDAAFPVADLPIAGSRSGSTEGNGQLSANRGDGAISVDGRRSNGEAFGGVAGGDAHASAAAAAEGRGIESGAASEDASNEDAAEAGAKDDEAPLDVDKYLLEEARKLMEGMEQQQQQQQESEEETDGEQRAERARLMDGAAVAGERDGISAADRLGAAASGERDAAAAGASGSNASGNHGSGNHVDAATGGDENAAKVQSGQEWGAQVGEEDEGEQEQQQEQAGVSLFPLPHWTCRRKDRPSFLYEQYRWQPEGCRVPRFNRTELKERLRNKKVAFVGDSVGLQQFFSFLCLISPTPRTHEPYIESRDSDYKFNWTTGWRGWQGSAYRFPETNTTVVLKWTTSLCHVVRKDWANESAGQAAHLDQPDEFLKQHMEEMDEYGWHFHLGGIPVPPETHKDMEGDFNLPMRTVLCSSAMWAHRQLHAMAHNKMQDGWQFHMGLLPIPSDTDKEMEGDFNVPMRTVLPEYRWHFHLHGVPVPPDVHKEMEGDFNVPMRTVLRSTALWTHRQLQAIAEERERMRLVAMREGGRGEGAEREGGEGGVRALPLVLLVTRSPAHFMDGQWNTGGGCDKLQVRGWGLLGDESMGCWCFASDAAGAAAVTATAGAGAAAAATAAAGAAAAAAATAATGAAGDAVAGTFHGWSMPTQQQADQLFFQSQDWNAEAAAEGTAVRLLNITALSALRPEAHLSRWYEKAPGQQDCVHCMLTQEETDRLHFQSRDWNAEAAVEGTAVRLLNITALSALRPEAHLSRWYDKDGKAPGQQDCVHWCLPGVPDTWNELLFWEIVRSGRFPLSGEVQGRGDRDGSSRLVQDM
ncbi:unnamed protein product [Closterium sp. NIES-64]|nr:unnamed protein product [Closterium sp. NIES-64]